jgi:hypothetical protein
MASIERFGATSWLAGIPPEAQARAGHALECGGVLFFRDLGFDLEGAEQALLSDHLADGTRKNITFDPVAQECHGTDLPQDRRQILERLMLRFSDCAVALVGNLIPAYRAHLERARVTFRPVEIDGRTYSPRKDDRLLHVDAFPSRPTSGRRILRLFTNINPDGQSRVWRVGEDFEDFATAFLPRLRRPRPLEPWLLDALGITKGRRSMYDHIMLQLHDRGKLDREYQRSAPYKEIAFPPNSTWICFTDQVLHAALSGRFALEQTFHLDVSHMIDTTRAPIRILERMTGMALA